MGYRFLEHTADVMFEAEADSLSELFIECSKALNETIHGNIKILDQLEKKIEVKADDLEGLLYKFLEEFLFLLDSENMVFGEIKDLTVDPDSFILRATLIGDSAEKYHFTNDVKAITFNNLKIKQKDKLYKVKMVLDV